MESIQRNQMNINTPYPVNPADATRKAAPRKSKVGRIVAIVAVVAVLALAGFFVWQISQRAQNQASLIKSANELHADDPRYVSFGSDYQFAVPKSYSVDESSIEGVQLLIPQGVETASLDNYDKLFDAAVIAAQAITEVTPNNNSSLKKYINDTLVADLKTNVSEDITTEFSYVGKYQAANIVVKKDDRQIRQIYAYSGTKPFMVVASSKSDAFVQVVNTLIGLSDANTKADIDQIKQTIQSNLALAQANKSQELFDGSASEFKTESTAKEVATGLTNSATFLKRNINVPGGTLLGSQFVGQLFFPGVAENEKASLGTIGLLKEADMWKLNSLELPAPPAPAPAPTTRR